MANPQCKLVIIGDPEVGKTSLVRRFSGSEFVKDSKPTMGINRVTATTKIGSQEVTLKIWDTAGQERYRAPIPYYDDAIGVMIVYDASRRNTFENVKLWLEEVRDHGPDVAKLVLVANKADVSSQDAVPSEEGQNLARAEGMSFFETSAAEGTDSIKAAFQSIIAVGN